MTTLLNTPNRRVALALIISALAHAYIMWLPYIQLPHEKVKLPPITVRIEHLARPAEKPAVKPAQANPIVIREGHPASKPPSVKLAKLEKTEETATPQPFPAHLQFTYVVHDGQDGAMTGMIVQQFDIHGDRYTLRSTHAAEGPARLKNSDRLVESSMGRIDDHGLHPESYEEQHVSRNGMQTLRVEFDHAVHQLRFADGSTADLPDDAQDRLSFLYQLVKTPANTEYFTLAVADTGQLQEQQIEVGARETIDTPLGKLRTLRLRKIHNSGEPYFEIWLGLEYRLLPVKYDMHDSNGTVTEEWVISDMRASEK